MTISHLQNWKLPCKKNSSPGLDQIDYKIINAHSASIRLALLDIYNDLFKNGLFPISWRASFVVFIPRANGDGLRPIALMSCFLKLFEKIHEMIHRRISWITQFVIPEFQASFRNFRSCTDNLIILSAFSPAS